MSELAAAPRKLKLLVGLPAYGAQIAMWQARMWTSLGFALAENPQFELLDVAPADGCFVDSVRNQFVAAAVDLGADWLLMVDNDNWHDGHTDNPFSGGYDLLRMIDDAQALDDARAERTGGDKGVALIAAPVPRRDPRNSHYMVYAKQRLASERPDGHCPVPQHQIMAEPEYDGRVTDCDVIATAMCAVNLRFLERARLRPPWFQKQNVPNTIAYLGEDLYFCFRAKEAGGRILVDGRFRGAHLQRPTPIVVSP